jgi:hypothetical protein
MEHKLTWLKDSIGQNYLGLKIDKNSISKYLEDLSNILDESDYQKFTDNQKLRDSGEYHLTFLGVSEVNRLISERGSDKFLEIYDKMSDIDVDLKMLGVGFAQRNSNKAYFIVCKSDILTGFRTDLGLSEKDFHITLGFYPKDVFGVRKNEVIEFKSKFLKLLKSKWIKSENFNFLKSIKNWDFLDGDINIINLNDNYLKIECGGFICDIGLDDLGEFRIFTKYPKTNEKILPKTEIIKILNEL